MKNMIIMFAILVAIIAFGFYTGGNRELFVAFSAGFFVAVAALSIVTWSRIVRYELSSLRVYIHTATVIFSVFATGAIVRIDMVAALCAITAAITSLIAAHIYFVFECEIIPRIFLIIATISMFVANLLI